MKAKYIISCAAISLAVWSFLFLFVLKKELTVGIYKGFFHHKLDKVKKTEAPRFFIIAGSNGLYSHDAETFEKKLGVPSVNLSMVAMFSTSYLLNYYQCLFQPGDTVYLPLEYHNYSAGQGNNSFGNIYEITIERNLSDLSINSIYRCFGSFDLHYLIQATAEGILVATGFKPQVSVDALTSYGDIANNTRANAAPYISYIKNMQKVKVDFSAPASDLKEFLNWALANKITVIGGLPTTFSDTVIPSGTLAKIEKLYTDHGAKFVITADKSLYPRECFFDTGYHLQRHEQIKHSSAVANEILRKYPKLFPRSEKNNKKSR